jgi:hypothetical protein
MFIICLCYYLFHCSILGLLIEKTVFTRSDTLIASCRLPSACYPHANNVFLQLGDVLLPVNDIKLHNTSFTVDSEYTLQKEQNNQFLSCLVKDDDVTMLADRPMLSPGKLISVGGL